MKLSIFISTLTLGLCVHAYLDAAAITTQRFGNDAPWYLDRIPLFESSNERLDNVYYYRWSIYRSHQRDLGSEGYITTEFIDDVSWQHQPWGSLIDATGFHLNEGKWLRDRRFKNDYASFMYGPNSLIYQFSERMADAVYTGYLVDGDADFATGLLEGMKDAYEGWDKTSFAGYVANVSMYYIVPLPDATEYSIASIDASGGYDGFNGGEAFRPSLTTYQFANAKAIANLADVIGDSATSELYNSRAAALQDAVHRHLWNASLEHFIDRHAEHDNPNVTYFQPIRGRELIGMVPWTHNLAIDNQTYAQSWKHILNKDELASPVGLRTVEPSYQYYMRQYRYEGTEPECQWNGPVWPFQTSQVLTGLENLLDHYPASQGVIANSDYTRLLLLYAELHYNDERGGILDIEEDYYPDTGLPIVGLARSPHYFHSAFNDHVLSGFVGIRPAADDTLVINPQADPTEIQYFRAERVIYHGHEIAIQWDANGSRYGTAGLQVEIDGEVVASSSRLERLTAPISKLPPPTYDSPKSKSIQLQSNTTYPHGNVSVPDADPNAVHDVIDGRIWFYPEIVNGWDTPSGLDTEVWYQIDFGGSTDCESAEVAFFASANGTYKAPTSIKIETRSDEGSWTEVPNVEYSTILANGITHASWDTLSTDLIRLVFTPQTGSSVRLVEFKVF